MVAQVPVPLTLVSGFLGAGKTTLLQNILNNKDGVKVAVIVNDLASVNVDANVISKDVKGDDSLVHLENGCICCDLNEEFVKQVVELSQRGGFDYIVVENTGVADPEPVAESLIEPSIAIGEAKDKLTDIVKLDTCVTVVDASTFFKHLHNSKRLNETELGQNADTEEAEALICQLMANQIEYADVVALNKTDLLKSDDIDDVTKAVQSLNPKAKVMPCEQGQIQWKKLLGTGSFSKINTAARPLAPGAAPRDSNFEDAVSSFVYTAHMPFHPGRLHAFIAANFNLHERDWSADLTQNAADALTTIASAAEAIRVAAKMLPRHSSSARRAADLASTAAAAAVAEAKASGTTVPALKPAAAKAKSAEGAAACGGGMKYGRILRSKGMVWLAGPDRFDHVGDWSLAGDVLQFTTGGPWMARLPLSLWPDNEEKKAEIFKEFGAGRGDRKQEVVFIGMDLDEAALRASLDACLCTHTELIKLERQLDGGELEDPFAPWPPIEAMLPDSDEEDDDDDEEEDAESEEGESEEVSEEEESESQEGTEVALEGLLDELEGQVEAGTEGKGRKEKKDATLKPKNGKVQSKPGAGRSAGKQQLSKVVAKAAAVATKRSKANGKESKGAGDATRVKVHNAASLAGDQAAVGKGVKVDGGGGARVKSGGEKRKQSQGEEVQNGKRKKRSKAGAA